MADETIGSAAVAETSTVTSETAPVTEPVSETESPGDPAWNEPDALAEAIKGKETETDDSGGSPAEDDSADDDSGTAGPENTPSPESSDTAALDAAAVSLAKEYELDPSSFSSVEALTAACRAIDKRFLKGSAAPAQTEPVSAAKAPAPAPVVDQGDGWAFTEDLPSADENGVPVEYDPGLKAYVGKFRDFVNSRLADIKAFAGEIVPVIQDHRASTGRTTIQKWRDSLDEDSKAIFGTGDLEDLDVSSPQYASLKQVVDAADVIRKGYQSSGQKVPKDSVLLDRAKWAIFGEQINQSAGSRALKKVEDGLRKRREGAIAPATNRSSTTPKTGIEVAIEHAKKHPFFSDR